MEDQYWTVSHLAPDEQTELVRLCHARNFQAQSSHLYSYSQCPRSHRVSLKLRICTDADSRSETACPITRRCIHDSGDGGNVKPHDTTWAAAHSTDMQLMSIASRNSRNYRSSMAPVSTAMSLLSSKRTLIRDRPQHLAHRRMYLLPTYVLMSKPTRCSNGHRSRPPGPSRDRDLK